MVAWALAAGVLVGGAAVAAAAASLGGSSSDGLITGVSVVVACDGDGIDVDFQLSTGDTVTDVVLGALADPGCEDAEMSVTLSDIAGTDIGSGGPVTVATDPDFLDNSVTIPVSPQLLSSTVINIDIVEVGP